VGKPVIFAIDDDPEVLRAVDSDLRKRYGGRYRVLRSNSPQAALKDLEQLKLKNEPLALLVVDQRMPLLSGIDFLEQALEIYPQSKRVLLTAYADSDAAIKAINKVQANYYLIKPWDPPQENLYPVLDDLLEDWQAGYIPSFEGLRVIGHRWSAASHQVKDFLARNQIPYHWLDVETEEATQLIRLGQPAEPGLPLVIFPDGTALSQPSNSQLGEKIGLKARPQLPFYDLVIVGSGPAGLAAAVYGASEGLKTLLVEKEAPGGQAGTSSKIENYLGFPSGLSGGDLARRGLAQARRFGVEVLTPQSVVGLRAEGPYRILQLADKSEVSCHAVVIATGVTYRELDVPGVKKLTGAGVYYGATMTEAQDCQDQEVFIVGGANSAGQAAMHFARYASYVHILYRGSTLKTSMSNYLIEAISNQPNIRVAVKTRVVEVHGQESLEAVTIEDTSSREITTLPAKALFVFIGAEPHTAELSGLVERDSNGFILTGVDLPSQNERPKNWPLARKPYLLETNIPGVFAVGDVRSGSVKRVASSVGEGAIAVQFIHKHLAEVGK
jgi:thioredoxin reductase (NADPH)